MSKFISQPTTAQSLGALLKSARGIMRKDNGLNGDLEADTTPRLSKPTSCVVYDMRRPFFESDFIAKHYRNLVVLQNIFCHARVLGCRSFVVEEIEPTKVIADEDLAIQRVFPHHRTKTVQRLTFWRKFLASEVALATVGDEHFAGYVIIKHDNYGERGDQWHVYESVLNVPRTPNMFIPRQSKYSVRCAGREFLVQGVMFCGQSRIRSCGYTNLRSVSSLLLDRDVTFQEIDAILNRHPKAQTGMTQHDVMDVLSALGIEGDLLDYSVMKSDSPIYSPHERLFGAITAGSAALLAFDTTPKPASRHLLFLFGYVLNPASFEFEMNSAYLGEPPTAKRSESLSPWIAEFVGADDNFGPYLQIPAHSALLQAASTTFSLRPKSLKTGDSYAAIVASGFMRTLQRFLDTVKKPKLLKDICEHELVFRPVAIPVCDYLSYLRSVRDWQNNQENSSAVGLVTTLLTPYEWVWAIEVTTPDFVRVFCKLGEIILRSDEPPSLKNPNSFGFLMARFPGHYIYEDTKRKNFFVVESSIETHTPFLQRGDNPMNTTRGALEYDIALSFAGENRLVAEKLAQLLSAKRVRVFYDKYEQANLWGKDLYQHLQVVYRDKARFCVVFLSEAYAKKLWTKHELRQAQARAFEENTEYILPLKVDDTEIPGINQTVGYLDLRSTPIEQVADLLLQKLNTP